MIINFSDEKVIHSTNSIFLAGPTSRVNPYPNSWRKDAVDILSKLGFDGIIYIPEYGHSTFNQARVEEQALWEREALESAGCVVFWVPRDVNGGMPAFTTNVEFGTYLQMKPHNISFGYPLDADKMWYLCWLYNYELPNDKVFHTLEETLENAIAITQHPNPIGMFYLSSESVYQVVAYDKINHCYIAKIVDDMINVYNPVKDNVELMDSSKILAILDEKIEVARSNYELYQEVYNHIKPEDNAEFFSVVQDLKTIMSNLISVQFLSKYNPMYNKHIIKVDKGYRRKLKRLYHILGEDYFNKFLPILEKNDYTNGSYWKNMLKSAENRKARVEKIINSKK